MVLPYENENYGEVGAKNISELLDVGLLSLTNGEVLKYNSSNEKWENGVETDTTYSGGTGVEINGANEISIGQSVANTDSPAFTELTVGNTGSNQGIINMQDFTPSGTDTLIQQKCNVQAFTTDGGRFEISVKEDGGSLVERFTILNTGDTIVDGPLGAIQGIETTTIRTMDNPSAQDHIGWSYKQVVSAYLNSGGTPIRVGSNVVLGPGVYYIKFQMTIDPNGNYFWVNMRIREVGGSALESHGNRYHGYNILPVAITHILVIPPLGTKDIEFIGENQASFGIGTNQDCRIEIIRIA